ncbi:MAG: hypothetical protein ACLSTO_12585, partial [Bilophila wadsworthia]
MLWWIFCGAAGLWIGMPNPVASFPAAALLYPASLFLLGTGSTSWKHASGSVGSAVWRGPRPAST